MTDREIELKLKAAFTKTVPAFPKTVLSQCSERKGADTDMKTKGHLGRAFKIILIAAALILILAATVSAITITNLIDPGLAIQQAVNHVVRTETDSRLHEELSEAVADGLTYDESLGTGEADLGLREGRIVYTVSFKTCGYEYKVVMDAKTGVVYSVAREEDEEWEEKLPDVKADAEEWLAELNERQKQQAEEVSRMVGEAPDYSFIRSRFDEHFGLPLSDSHFEAHDDYKTRNAACSIKTEGYIYTATINCDTGEVLEDCVAVDPDYEGERVLHEKIGGIISFDEADRLAEQAVLSAYPEAAEGTLQNKNVTNLLAGEENGEYQIVSSFTFFANTDESEDIAGDFIFTVKLRAADGTAVDVARSYGLETIRAKAREYCGLDDECITFGSANDSGECSFESEPLGKGVKVVIDPVTLELISKEEYEVTEYKKSYEPNGELSGEAPDGMISEAAAATAALEYVGANEVVVQGLTAELNGSVYRVSFKFGLKDFPKTRYLRLNTFEVDAVTGEILSADAISPDDYLSEEEAIERAKALTVEWGELTEKEAAELEPADAALVLTAMGYYQYNIRLQRSGDSTVFIFEIDPISGQDLINR